MSVIIDAQRRFRTIPTADSAPEPLKTIEKAIETPAGAASVLRPEVKLFKRDGFLWDLMRILSGLALTAALFAFPLQVLPGHFGIVSAVFAFCCIAGVGLIIAMIDTPIVVAAAVFAAILQNSLLGIFHGDDGGIGVIVNETKTILALCVTAVILGKSIVARRLANRLVIVLVLYGLAIIGFSAGFDASFISNARNFAFPVILLATVAVCKPRRDLGGLRFARILVGIVTAILISGSLAELFLGSEKWKSLLHATALPGLNSLSQTTMFAGFELSRVGGFLLEPVNAGYAATFIVLCVIILMMRGIRHGKISAKLAAYDIFVIVSCFAVIALASTKNSLLMIAVGIVGYLLSWIGFPKIWAFISAIIFGIAATFLYTTAIKGPGYIPAALADPVAAAGGESTSIHNAGLISGVKSLFSAPFGHGVGSGGNFYRLYHPSVSRRDWLESGSESAIGTFLYQLGFIAVIVLIAVTVLAFKKLTEESIAVLAAFATASFFAESIFGAIVAIPAFLVIGYLRELPPLIKISRDRANRSSVIKV